MPKLKVPYKTRNKLQRAIQQTIQRQGLVDTYSLKDSVRISSVSGDLNQVTVTVNALYYYMFLDKGAKLWNGGIIRPFEITERALEMSLGQEFAVEIVEIYLDWLSKTYPILDNAKLLGDVNLTIQYNLFGDPSGKWNGIF